MDNLEQHNILVTTDIEWDHPSMGSSPQTSLPDSVDSNGNTDNGQIEDAPVAILVFDETTGEFIEIENTNVDTSGAGSNPVADTQDAEQGDWVVYTNPDTADGVSMADGSSSSGDSAGAIDWDAGEEVNELLPPPPPGRSGMKHSKGNGASAG